MIGLGGKSNGHPSWPRLSLTITFLSWKTVLFAIAVCSPGPGYDTSTTILHPQRNRWAVPFVRWDAIYFTQIARRGYMFEQDWAFSWGLTQLMRLGSKYLWGGVNLETSLAEAWIGIIISHLSHLIAVQILYDLTLRLFRPRPSAPTAAYIAACLHIFSPAGMFLSAPFSESLFAALQFAGYHAYIGAWKSERSTTPKACARLLSAGVCFALAMMVRSNGLLSGILFAHDALYLGLCIVRGRCNLSTFALFVTTIFAGSFIAMGAAYPQFLAYREYCSSPDPLELRPWCRRYLPSIYAFVQVHYWNNGFLRYWTLSNVPLFLLAAPMLWILGESSLWAWTPSLPAPGQGSIKPLGTVAVAEMKTLEQMLQILAVPQAVLTVATFFNSHVQIITRIASGYPVWYLWLAFATQGQLGVRLQHRARYLTRWMVIYAMIQGGLFASFLPPA